jgi:hypothetical protein
LKGVQSRLDLLRIPTDVEEGVDDAGNISEEEEEEEEEEEGNPSESNDQEQNRVDQNE